MHRVLFFSCVLVAAAVTLAECVTPAVAEPNTAQVIEMLKQTEGRVKSAIGTTVVSMRGWSPAVPGVAGPGTVDTTRKYKYKWAFQAPEWRHEFYATSGSDASPTNYEGFRNGTYTIYDPRSKAMQVYGAGCAGKVGVHPLWAQHIGFAFLLDDRFPATSTRIAAAGATVTGQDSVGGDNVVVLQGVSPQGQVVRWWLCPEHGYLPSRVEERWADPACGCKQIVVLTVYSDFTEIVEGVWLPRTNVVTKTVTHDDGSVTEDLRVEATNDFVAVNTSLTADQLDIVPAPGTTVVYTESIKTAQ